MGGEILSHDFVEAALLRRGGWQVWIADDIGQSYEEPPPSIADFATRDRRWCQGNMQHIKVLFLRDLHWVSRLHLAIGILSYLTSPLWLVFLLLSSAQAWELAYGEPVYFTDGWPFPTLPVSVAAEAALLLGVTLGLLFLPKVMGLALALIDGPRRRDLGGGPRLLASAILETLLSALVAPVMMLLHTGFVATILLGSAIDWHPQRRQVAGGLLRESARRFGWVTAIGLAASIATFKLTPALFFWLTPVFSGLLLAIPLAMWTSSEAWGERLRKLGLLRVIEEASPPQVMRRLDELLATPADAAADRFPLAVLNPGFNALHIAMLRSADEHPPVAADQLRPLERKAVYLGAGALSKPERRMLLENPATMARLHLASWLHWRSDHHLAWETEDPLPPGPHGLGKNGSKVDLGRRMSDGAAASHAAGRAGRGDPLVEPAGQVAHQGDRHEARQPCIAWHPLPQRRESGDAARDGTRRVDRMRRGSPCLRQSPTGPPLRDRPPHRETRARGRRGALAVMVDLGPTHGAAAVEAYHQLVTRAHRPAPVPASELVERPRDPEAPDVA